MPDYLHKSNWYTTKSKLSSFTPIGAKNMQVICTPPKKKLDILFHWIGVA